MIHDMSCHTRPFTDIWIGLKKAEVRQEHTHRKFKEGDSLVINEINEKTGCRTGRIVRAIVTHVQRDHGLPEDLAVVSFHATTFTDVL